MIKRKRNKFITVSEKEYKECEKIIIKKESLPSNPKQKNLFHKMYGIFLKYYIQDK